eukprot:CAMPEP_0179879916 /NCGR_PEP_ID=MMETSP0982-20121206/26480_1 /TAXON_ID=483367 /ORGANISM="non described non described, Strain CCMP 2436" /LENGTH=127 /DNA_ID=CAMNT_0021773417 /DNA_START=954 /DNA_END=1333 /DNA_ORIENTATION=-
MVAASEAQSLAIAASLMKSSPASFITAARHVSKRDDSIAARHLRKFELNGVESRDWSAERLPFGRVLRGAVKRSLCNSERLRGDANAPAIQCRHRDFEALSRLSEQICAGHANVLEDQVRSGGAANA